MPVGHKIHLVAEGRLQISNHRPAFVTICADPETEPSWHKKGHESTLLTVELVVDWCRYPHCYFHLLLHVEIRFLVSHEIPQIHGMMVSTSAASVRSALA